MNVRRACQADVPLLAELNELLIRAEGHRNRMTISELEGRMHAWLAGEYDASVFELGATTIGYALYRQAPQFIYLRQFFIREGFRRKGHGSTAFRWLADHVWTDHRLRLDVLVTNEVGISFWRSLGFSDYCITMERGELPI